MRGVVVDLGSLVGSQGIFDGQLVQPELVGELVELLPGGLAEVDPDDGVGPLEVLGHVGDGEVLGFERPFAVHPGSGHRASSVAVDRHAVPTACVQSA